MALRFVDVHHRYGGHAALEGVSLHVHPGECYGFIGHNGAGKSTTMRIAMGLVRPRSGRVWIAGVDALRDPIAARASLGGLVEAPSFHADLSARANLDLLARAAGASRREARSDAERVLERVGLTAEAGRRVGGFSQGMKQRLGIAQALLGSPRLILLDEPTNGLDPEGIRDARSLFQSLVRDDGAALLISSHQLHELEGLCERVGVLRRGKLVLEDRVERLFGAAGGTYRLRTSSPDRAQAVLAGLGLDTTREGEDQVFTLADRPPSEVTRALIEANVELLAFAPKPPTLEEIVLAGEGRVDEPAMESARHAATESPMVRDVPASAVGTPRGPRPRAGGFFRALRYEARRLARPSLALAALAPAAVGVLAQLARHRAVARDLAAVEAGELFGATAVTGFEAVGLALRAGLPVLVLIGAGLASQSLAGELARRTLRNLLFRPLARASVAAGKAVAHLGLAAVSYLLLIGASLLGAGALFDFGDVVEVLPNGAEYVHLAAADVRPELEAVLFVCLLPVLGCVALGVLAGALVRTGAVALGLALGMLAATDVARGFARPLGWEDWLLTAALPGPLSDRSAVASYLDFCSGVSNVSPPVAEHPARLALAWLLPCLALAAWRLSRRAIP